MPDADLVIRTGGEHRLSNFLLWRAAGALFWSTPVLWPDFRREHLLAAIQFCRQQRGHPQHEPRDHLSTEDSKGNGKDIIVKRGNHLMIDQMLLDLWTNLYRRPRFGLALSGGGARGLTHIGVLKVLAREEIPVDYLAGTSMGGLIAAAYASGMRPDEIESEALAITRWRGLASLADLKLARQGLFRGDRLLAYFERHFGQRTFPDLDLPLALTAVDLNTGQEIILRQGPVALAVRATVAIPGLLAPVEIDGKRLADGGLLNNLPTDVVRRMGAGAVIAVDVASKRDGTWANDIHWAPKGVSGTLQVLSESVGIMRNAIEEERLRYSPPEVLIRPDIPANVNVVFGLHRAEEMIDAGERAAEAALPQIREQIRPRWRGDVRSTTLSAGITHTIPRRFWGGTLNGSGYGGE